MVTRRVDSQAFQVSSFNKCSYGWLLLPCCQQHTYNKYKRSQLTQKGNLIYYASADYSENSLRIDRFSYSDLHLLQKYIYVGKSSTSALNIWKYVYLKNCWWIFSTFKTDCRVSAYLIYL